MSSILNDIKKQLGYYQPYSTSDPAPFDSEIMMHINAQIATLRQVGVGPKNGFRITGTQEEWTDFLVGENDEMNCLVPEFVYLKVKLIFDPPGNSFTCDALQKQADEDIWRIRELAEGRITPNAGSNNSSN